MSDQKAFLTVLRRYCDDRMERAKQYGNGVVKKKVVVDAPSTARPNEAELRDVEEFDGYRALLGGFFLRDASIDAEMATLTAGFPRNQGVKTRDDWQAVALGVPDMVAARVCASDTFRVDEAKWSTVTTEALTHLKGAEPPAVVVAALDGLAVNDVVQLSTNLRIRPLTPDERATHVVSGWHERYLGVDRCSCGVEFVSVGAADADEGVLLAVVQALQTWCARPVDWVVWNRTSPFRAGDAAFRTERRHDPFRTPQWLPDPHGFAEMWLDAGEAFLKPDDPLSVGLTRFYFMHEFPRPADRILDEMIIFEALLLNRQSAGEIRHQLSERAGLFLRARPEDRRGVRDTIKKVYDLRSTIAHGAKPSPKREGLLAEAHGLTRELLRKYATILSRRRRSGRQFDLGSELDEAILGAPQVI